MSPKGEQGGPCPTCKGKGFTLTIVHGGRGVWKRQCPVCDGWGVRKGDPEYGKGEKKYTEEES